MKALFQKAYKALNPQNENFELNKIVDFFKMGQSYKKDYEYDTVGGFLYRTKNSAYPLDILDSDYFVVKSVESLNNSGLGQHVKLVIGKIKNQKIEEDLEFLFSEDTVVKIETNRVDGYNSIIIYHDIGEEELGKQEFYLEPAFQ